jgi:hypothetical protein
MDTASRRPEWTVLMDQRGSAPCARPGCGRRLEEAAAPVFTLHPSDVWGYCCPACLVQAYQTALGPLAAHVPGNRSPNLLTGLGYEPPENS